MIEFFTDDFESLKDSLAPSEKCIPEWFKAQSSKCPVTHKFSSKPSEHVLTLKRCPGVLDYLTQGYTLKMWEDIEVSIKQDYLLDFNYKIENVDELRTQNNQKTTFEGDKVEAIKKGEYRAPDYNLTKHKKSLRFTPQRFLFVCHRNQQTVTSFN
jgi:hypothetical protein